MNSGLNGWLGRALKSLIVKAARVVDAYLAVNTLTISSEIGSFGDWADEIGSGGSSFWNRTANVASNTESIEVLNNDVRGNYEPTASEMLLLENFSEKVGSIIVDVVEEKSLILEHYNKTKNVDVQTYEMINILLQRIAIIKEFYKNNQNHSLSTQAIDLRNLMLEVLFNPIITEVETLGNYNANFSLKNVAVEVPNASIVQETSPYNYQTTKSFMVKYLEFQKNLKVTLPVDVITEPIDTPIEEIGNDVIQIPIEGDNTVSNPTIIENENSSENEKKTTFPWLLLLAGFIGYKVLK
ncbi:hypothetical protein FLCU109888_11500 [Flavobacterium cucumis]|uniref:Uncharacterized protein n=1 Tax=Flavobacterium cucumis TaxID=416016 RepID=A0A1M7ZVJ0_9FLAO|nr:hypothetical protein [Flavobacterium cucumis]SHO72876.1 hypothetical protein SAMN05443547_1220 [Flavobacterium cucumis]